eukprot:COSAG01_NODE_1428_length_10331_cov_68.357995_2_plen_180_part_00
MWIICGPFSSPPQISMWTAWSTWSTCPNANPARDGNASEMGTPACPTPRCGTLARVSHRVKGVVVQPWLCSVTVIPSVTFAYSHRVATTHQAMKDSRSDTITNAQYKYPPPFVLFVFFVSSSSSSLSSYSWCSMHVWCLCVCTRGATHTGCSRRVLWPWRLGGTKRSFSKVIPLCDTTP